jgi:hypothetical protein
MGLKVEGKTTSGRTDGKRDGRLPPAHQGWSDQTTVKQAGHMGWNGKTMHHPAFRIGEVKRGRS